MWLPGIDGILKGSSEGYHLTRKSVMGGVPG